MADIPGLIEGAHEGKGLGDKFLKHVERTRVLLHLVDCQADDPAGDYAVVQKELAGYSAELGRRPCMVVATKVEDEAALGRAAELETAVGRRVLRISAATQSGLPELVTALLQGLRAQAPAG